MQYSAFLFYYYFKECDNLKLSQTKTSGKIEREIIETY